MLNENSHPTEQELVLAADGELPSRRADQVRAHLAACWDCRSRMAETEKTIADFTRAYREGLDSQLPPLAGPRSLLKVRLAQLTAKPEFGLSRRFFQFTGFTRAAAYVCAALLLIAVTGTLLFQHSTPRVANLEVSSFERGEVPDRSLTPGAARRVRISDVCSMAHEDVVREVSTSLRQKVFQEYGIGDARASDYEIDYLIAPGLGGEEDIHNLWPEPYSSSAWNAHVKDALEEHLHQMVCAGRLNLSTAQRDIATDWIAAYKKYFHTDKPLAVSSDLIQLLEFSFEPSSLQPRAGPRHFTNRASIYCDASRDDSFVGIS